MYIYIYIYIYISFIYYYFFFSFFLGGGGGDGGQSCHSPSDWLLACLGNLWMCVTILPLSLEGVPLWDQSILSSPSTVLIDWLGDIP